VPLARALSKLGIASRSEARALITAGRVTINGKRVVDPDRRVTPEAAAIAIDGRAAERAAAPIVIALHKPRGYVTTRSDPEGRKTVYDLIADLPQRVVPVGRLDLATSGLLLFTNDTRLADWLTDPRHAIARVYLVTVDGRVTADHLATLQRGVRDDGEQLRAAAAELRKVSGKESHLTITLTTGRNREVRRLLDAIGHPVTRLRRVEFGGVGIGGLQPGEWRQLSAAEMRAAFPAYGRAPFDSPSAASGRRSAQGWPAARKRVPRPK
jgi:23S rRNA pseudouridine2605 synthase